jgi:hypothetical protein
VVYEAVGAMGGSAGVAGVYEMAEGKTLMSDGVASSGMTGIRRTTSPLVTLQRSEVS